MRYFLAIGCPPLGVLSTCRLLAALLNISMVLPGWIPGSVDACLVIRE